MKYMYYFNYIAALMIISLFSIDNGAAQSNDERYELPEWVPEGAIRTAMKRIPMIEQTAKHIAPLYSDKKKVTPEEAAKEYKDIELKYAYEIVNVKRQGYSEGDNLLDYFYCYPSKVAPILQRVGFGVVDMSDLLGHFVLDFKRQIGGLFNDERSNNQGCIRTQAETDNSGVRPGIRQ